MTSKNTRVLNYFLPPPIINSQLVYQNINKDPNLRKSVTNFYLKKVIKWLSSYDEFKHAKKSLKYIKSENGYNIIYNLLRHYVNKNNTNWYDLKESYINVKDYLRYKLGNLTGGTI
jgi:hypothetical protein